MIAKRMKISVTRRTSWTCACLKSVEQNEGEGVSSLARRETEEDGAETRHASDSLDAFSWIVVDALISLSVAQVLAATVVFVKIYNVLV